MSPLKTIDEEMAVHLHDRLYYVVRMNLIDRKLHDNFVKDQRAREITDELVRQLDGFYIGLPLTRDPKQSWGRGDDGPQEDDAANRARRAGTGRPHLLPIMNAKPVTTEAQSDVQPLFDDHEPEGHSGPLQGRGR